METLQFLRERISALVDQCTDESLLDLIYKLLLDISQSV